MFANDPKKLRIAVIGIGGVGGYLASHLCRTCPNVTLVARGARGDHLQNKGLHLSSLTEGESITRSFQVLSSAALLPPQDLILICVKNYSLESVLSELSSAVTKDTVILPVLNGIDPAQRTRALLPGTLVLKSLIYIISYSDPSFKICHTGKETALYIGLEDPDAYRQQILDAICQLLKDSGINCLTAENIDLEIWKKYILNCGYNVSTAYYRAPVGELRKDPAKAADFKALILEACETGRAAGIPVPQSYADFCIDRFLNYYPPSATSSLQRDIMAGRPAEIETFSGTLVRKAKELHIPVPVSARIYEELKKYTLKVSQNNVL